MTTAAARTIVAADGVCTSGSRMYSFAQKPTAIGRTPARDSRNTVKAIAMPGDWLPRPA